MMSLNCSKKRCTTSHLVGRMAGQDDAHEQREDTMIGQHVARRPALESGFFGMMSSRVSVNDTSVLALPDRVEVSDGLHMLDMSTPQAGVDQRCRCSAPR